MAKILIIDDHRIVAELLREEICLDGHEGWVTREAKEMGELLVSVNPDLVILDLFLGKEERWDLLEKVTQRFARIPVIVYTSHDGYVGDLRIAQAAAFVIKSSSFEEIQRRIVEILMCTRSLPPIGGRSRRRSAPSGGTRPKRTTRTSSREPLTSQPPG